MTEQKQPRAVDNPPVGINDAVHSPDGAAVRLTGLHKSFGKVQAVRGVDLQIAPGEVVAFLGPNGAGKSTTIDMLLGLTRPDSGTVSLFGTSPAAGGPGRPGRCDAAGRRIAPGGHGRRTDLDVRRAAPVADAGRRGDGPGRDHRHRQAADQQALRWAGPAGAVRPGPRPRSGPAGAGRTDRRHGRRGAQVVLGVDARLHRQRTDGAVRHPLPRRGRRLRRSGRGAGRRHDRRGRHRSPDQGIGGRPDHLGGDPRCSAGRPVPTAREWSPSSRRPAGCCCAATTPTRRCGHCWQTAPAAHDIEITAGNLEDAFLELTAANRQESHR